MLREKYRKARNGKNVGIVLMVFGVFTGVMLSYTLAQIRDRQREAMTWPEVEGTVVSSDVREEESLSRVGKRMVSTTEYVHEWKVSYQVDGEPYTHDSHYNYLSDSEARKAQRRRPVGAAVRLHCNPANPLDMMLHRDSESDPLVGVAFGSFLVMVGMLIFAWHTRRMRKLARQIRGTALPPREQHWEEASLQARPTVELETAKYLGAASR